MSMGVCGLLCALVIFVYVLAQEEQKLSSEELRALGDRALQAGSYEEAVQLYTKLLHEEPNRQINFYKRSMAYVMLKKLDLALNDINSALIQDPDFTQGVFHRAKLQKRLGKCEEAIRDFEKIKGESAYSAEADEALQGLRKCRELKARADALAAKKAWQEIRHVLLELNDIITDASKYLQLEIRALFETGDYQSVIQKAGKLLMFDKNNVETMMLRGQAYYQTGDDDMALK